jgi:hypothetical protein
MYELFLCVGITWAGCGASLITPFPGPTSRADCYAALEAMRVDTNATLATNGNGRQLVAYCRPTKE